MSDETHLTIRQAADLLHIQPETLRVWLRLGRIGGTKTITGHWRISRAEVDRARGVAEEPMSTEAGA